MHEDHDVSCQARQKDILCAEDLGILLQWHWKYGTATFTNERQRVQLSLLMLFSAFTGSRPDTLLGEDDSSSKNSQESSIGDLSDNTLADNSDEDTLTIGLSRMLRIPKDQGPSATGTSSSSFYGIPTIL